MVGARRRRQGVAEGEPVNAAQARVYRIVIDFYAAEPRRYYFFAWEPMLAAWHAAAW